MSLKMEQRQAKETGKCTKPKCKGEVMVRGHAEEQKTQKVGYPTSQNRTETPVITA